MMRFVRTLIAVLPVLVLSTPAHAQYGLYGAPSTLPLSSPQPVCQSTYQQNPPLYVDTNTATGPASPVVADPAPVYAQPAYANPAYANPVYANPTNANLAYANAATPVPSQSGAARPGVLPTNNQVPYDPGYATPIMRAAAYQAGAKKLPPPQRRPPHSLVCPGRSRRCSARLRSVNLKSMLRQQQPAAQEYGNCCDPCSTPCCANWFGSVAFLYMSRNEPNRLWTTYDSADNTNQLPTDALTEWGAGGEVSFGRYFCCGCFAVEATYWGLESLNGYSSQSISGGTVSTPPAR